MWADVCYDVSEMYIARLEIMNNENNNTPGPGASSDDFFGFPLLLDPNENAPTIIVIINNKKMIFVC